MVDGSRKNRESRARVRIRWPGTEPNVLHESVVEMFADLLSQVESNRLLDELNNTTLGKVN